MSSTAPDTYEAALEAVLDERGLQKAKYVASIEQENIALRRLLLDAKPFIPSFFKARMEKFFPMHAKDPYKK